MSTRPDRNISVRCSQLPNAVLLNVPSSLHSLLSVGRRRVSSLTNAKFIGNLQVHLSIDKFQNEKLMIKRILYMYENKCYQI